MTDTRLKIAVFIDFDNIEIGVKTTLGGHFDIGPILDAVKERGEIVTKIAYGDWKPAGDHSRSLTQHAIKMVQRNMTPGGDKNGADINLALDALEMAFTHHHINAFVIVGGDSDFISLVEKLKQYDKKVFVVGGRAFTSAILQKNCHEFIAYENLISGPSPSRRPAERGRPGNGAQLSQVFPLVRRAMKVLADREVSPQIGLLKSTLLQLDSTFSERDYGASTFRDFTQKLADAGLVHLKETGRNLMVELRDAEAASSDRAPRSTEPGRTPPQDGEPSPARAPGDEPAASPEQLAEGIRAIRKLFEMATTPPRWPMYVRNLKQFLKSVDASFDERRYGFGGILEVLRHGQREGIFRLERGRGGVLRVYPGATMLPLASSAPSPDPPQTSATLTALESTPAVLDVSAGVAPASEEPAAPAAPDDALVAEAAESVITGPAARSRSRRRRSTAAARATTGARKPQAARARTRP